MESALQCILFFNVHIKVNNKNIGTWHKPTCTALLLNYNANCPKKWKSRLILCLLYRAKLIFSNNILYFNEVDVLRNLFVSNVTHFHLLKNVSKILLQNFYISILHVMIMLIILTFQNLAMPQDSLSINYKALSTLSINEL